MAAASGTGRPTLVQVRVRVQVRFRFGFRLLVLVLVRTSGSTGRFERLSRGNGRGDAADGARGIVRLSERVGSRSWRASNGPANSRARAAKADHGCPRGREERREPPQAGAAPRAAVRGDWRARSTSAQPTKEPSAPSTNASAAMARKTARAGHGVGRAQDNYDGKARASRSGDAAGDPHGSGGQFGGSRRDNEAVDRDPRAHAAWPASLANTALSAKRHPHVEAARNTTSTTSTSAHTMAPTPIPRRANARRARWTEPPLEPALRRSATPTATRGACACVPQKPAIARAMPRARTAMRRQNSSASLGATRRRC